jgi:LysM repeat protein
VRIPLLFLSVFFLAAVWGAGQVPDPGQAATQDPGIAQDTEAAREKLLKAADELDMIQANSESNKAAVDAMKAELGKLEADNADLKQQVAAMQAKLDAEAADRAKERQSLVEDVAALVAAKAGAEGHAAKHHVADEGAAESSPADGDGPTAHHETIAEADAPTGDKPDKIPPAHPQKGYYYTVQRGDTLAMICAAYRDEGVKVTTAQVRKANGLTATSELKAGEKLFIPKPGD